MQVTLDETSRETNSVSLYRTRWLMAHNTLHKLREIAPEEWTLYLRELKTAEEVSRKEA